MRSRRNSQLAYPVVMENALLDLLDEKKQAIAATVQRLEAKQARGQRTNDADFVILRTSLPVDFRDLPDHYPKKRMMTLMRSVPLEIRVWQEGDPAGSWTHTPASRQKLRVFVQPYELDGNGRLSARAVNALRGTLRHELRHMIQSMMTAAFTGKSTGITHGIPAGSWEAAQGRYQAEIQRLSRALAEVSRHSPRAGEIRKELDDLQGKWSANYYLDPAEFYPHMGNAKDELLGGRLGLGEAGFRQGSPIDRSTYERVIRTYPLFPVLQRFAPDIYRKAVGDLAAWMNAHNEALSAAKSARPLTTAQILSALLARLDKDDPATAAEIRTRRPFYEAYIASLVK